LNAATIRKMLAAALTALPLAAIVVLLAARALHFASSAWPEPFDRLLGELMFVPLIAFMNTLRHLPLLVLLAIPLIILIRFKPNWYVDGRQDRAALRPWCRIVLLSGLLLFNVVLDMSPYVAAWSWATWGLLAVTPFAWNASNSRRSQARLTGVWAAAVLLAAQWSPSAIDTIGIACWAGAAVLIVPFAAPRIARFDVLILLALVAAIVQVGITVAPALGVTEGASRLGDGYAYSYCEQSDGHVLAFVPACEGALLGECVDGYLAEYELVDGSAPMERLWHEPFDGTFYGRGLHLLCLDDRIQLGMAQTIVGGVYRRESVVELRHEGKSIVRSDDLFEGSVGHRMARDTSGGRDAVFYVSEWSGAIYRWDRISGEVRRDLGAFLDGGTGSAATGRPVTLAEQAAHATAKGIFEVPASLQTEIDAIDRRREVVFFVEWLSGSRVFGLDLGTFELVMSLDTRAGPSHSLVIDHELDRLIVSGLWGIEVFDLGSGRRIARQRLGTGPRLPLIDERHGIVYVPTTYGGGVWALDRETYAVLGRIDVGNGSRNGLLTRDGLSLFASSSFAHYHWDAEVLARRFGRK
jgi:hypothetical protein